MAATHSRALTTPATRPSAADAGVVTCTTAAITNLGGLLATRVFLGITEAGVNQTMLYHLSQFYGPDRLAMALSLGWLVGGSIASTFGGLIAAFILWVTRGVTALEPWQFLFLLEGIPCFVVFALVLYRVPNSPVQCKSFMRPEQYAFLLEAAEKEQERKRRLSAELAGDDLSFLTILCDKRVLLLSAVLFCTSPPGGPRGVSAPRCSDAPPSPPPDLAQAGTWATGASSSGCRRCSATRATAARSAIR